MRIGDVFGDFLGILFTDDEEEEFEKDAVKLHCIARPLLLQLLESLVNLRLFLFKFNFNFESPLVAFEFEFCVFTETLSVAGNLPGIV